jgi:hypothetical protein
VAVQLAAVAAFHVKLTASANRPARTILTVLEARAAPLEAAARSLAAKVVIWLAAPVLVVAVPVQLAAVAAFRVKLTASANQPARTIPTVLEARAAPLEAVARSLAAMVVIWLAAPMLMAAVPAPPAP